MDQTHEQLVGAAIFLPLMLVAASLVFFLVPPESRVFAGRAVVAVSAVLIAAFVAWVRFPLAPLKSAPAGMPTVTIGGHFERTRAYFARIMIPVLAVWAAGLVLFADGLSKMQHKVLGIGGGLVLFLIGMPFYLKRLRCPRCGTIFRKERIAKFEGWSTDRRAEAELWDACPHCGVSFNDPWP